MNNSASASRRTWNRVMNALVWASAVLVIVLVAGILGIALVLVSLLMLIHSLLTFYLKKGENPTTDKRVAAAAAAHTISFSKQWYI